MPDSDYTLHGAFGSFGFGGITLNVSTKEVDQLADLLVKHFGWSEIESQKVKTKQRRTRVLSPTGKAPYIVITDDTAPKLILMTDQPDLVALGISVLVVHHNWAFDMRQSGESQYTVTQGDADLPIELRRTEP